MKTYVLLPGTNELLSKVIPDEARSWDVVESWSTFAQRHTATVTLRANVYALPLPDTYAREMIRVFCLDQDRDKALVLLRAGR